MKKQLLVFTLLFLLSGCSVSDSATMNEGSISDSSSSAPSTYVRPDSRADISGTIKSIIGNEITISGRDMSEVFGTSGESDFRDRMTNMTDEERTKMREAMNSAKIINTKVTIPVGIAMGKRVVTRTTPPANSEGTAPSLGSTIPGSGAGFGGRGGGQGRPTNGTRGNGTGNNLDTPSGQGTLQEASLADLKVGSNIDIWLDKNQKERKIADNALITEIKTATN